MTEKQVAVIVIHGMVQSPLTGSGLIASDYAQYSARLRKQVSRKLGAGFSEVEWIEVVYKDLLMANQNRYWQTAKTGLCWRFLRMFMLFGFSDAASIEAGKEDLDSTYKQVQARIAKAILTARAKIGDRGSIIIAAHSLGCEVFSNYLWDTQKYHANQLQKRMPGYDLSESIFSCPAHYGLTEQDLSYLMRPAISHLISFGCNIPIFVAGHEQIVPIQKPTTEFSWDNFFAKADVLGWPLSELSANYANLVHDHPMWVVGNIWDILLKSWNPFSHLAYWNSKSVSNAVSAAVNRKIWSRIHAL